MPRLSLYVDGIAAIQMLVAGDYNAPHTTWGYGTSCAWGTCVNTVTDALFLLLIIIGHPWKMPISCSGRIQADDDIYDFKN